MTPGTAPAKMDPSRAADVRTTLTVRDRLTQRRVLHRLARRYAAVAIPPHDEFAIDVYHRAEQLGGVVRAVRRIDPTASVKASIHSAGLLAAAATRDTLASERDKVATARDLAASLQELGGAVESGSRQAPDFAANDRRASREDRIAAAADRRAASADRAALTDGKTVA